jgi:small subunit ribosomal protein S1
MSLERGVSVAEETEDFATMFEASIKPRRIDKGQTVTGTVVAIGAEVAFVDVGGKGEATITLDELRDADGVLEVAVGDRIQAVVVSTDGGLTLSRKLARGAATAHQLEEAAHSGLPVEGRVERVVKGGFEVRIGGARAFCPFSQIDTIRTEPAIHEGRIYEFRIVEYKDGGRNLVVSRRALLEERQRASAADVRRSILPGAVLTGRVASVREFGAFVDLGAGVQGLLHVSEMGWSRVVDPSQVVKPGDEISVTVLRVDDHTQRIALGLKQLTGDPWAQVPQTYVVGQVYSGRVTRTEDFGAFVELEPGVEALAHASSFAPSGRAGGWKKVAGPNTTGAFEILSIDVEKRRIGVAMVPEGSPPPSAGSPVSTTIAPGARLTGKVERHEKFGVFVFLAPGRTGLIPMHETGMANESDVPKAFPIAADVEVIVLEADDSGRRIRLSAKAVQQSRDAEDVREYTQRADAAPGEGFGSLADKLRGALEPRRKP